MRWQEIVEQVEWRGLEHAQGAAHDVPETLAALVSADAHARSEAKARLWRTLWSQGATFEATAHAAPALVAMLDDPRADRPWLLYFMAHLASGKAPQRRDRLACLSAHRHAQRTQRAIAQATPRLLQLLASPDAFDRMYAAHTLAALPHTPEAERALWTTTCSDPDARVRATCLWAFDALLGDTRETLRLGTALLGFEGSPLVLWTLAITWHNLRGERTPRELIAHIERAALDPAPIAHDWADLPFAERSVTTIARDLTSARQADVLRALAG